MIKLIVFSILIFGALQVKIRSYVFPNINNYIKLLQAIGTGVVKGRGIIAGFTLAEVLITLLIIGVLASLVVPNLVQDTQDAELKVAWRKAYSEIDQATRKVMMDNGGSLKGLFAGTSASARAQSMRNYYLKYLNYTKECPTTTCEGNCWHRIEQFYWLNGNPVHDNNWNDYGAVLMSNGMFVIFTGISTDCTDTSALIPRCGTISVDVNGWKGPNKVGKDIFLAHILENGIKPYGTQGDSLQNMCRSNSNGYTCSAEYLYQ